MTIDDVGRPEPPVAANEVETLLGYLDYQRSTLEWKTRGLTREQLSVTIAASTMTLGGLLKHMAFVERYWFAKRLHGQPMGEPWGGVDWKAEPDWEWTSSLHDEPAALRDLWQRCCDESRTIVGDALRSGSLDTLCVTPWPNGDSPSLRWVLVHMIEEYARHNGHADLLREFVDGETGE
jgi:uncharacterized damage-inducible protein DinB